MDEVSYNTRVKSLEPGEAVAYIEEHCGPEDEEGDYDIMVDKATDKTTLGDLVDEIREQRGETDDE